MNRTLMALLGVAGLSFGLGFYVSDSLTKGGEKILKQPLQADEFYKRRYEQLLKSLPNYNDVNVWSGDSLGNVYVDENLVIRDLREKYELSIRSRLGEK